jgi:hypothetical protein
MIQLVLINIYHLSRFSLSLHHQPIGNADMDANRIHPQHYRTAGDISITISEYLQVSTLSDTDLSPRGCVVAEDSFY